MRRTRRGLSHKLGPSRKRGLSVDPIVSPPVSSFSSPSSPVSAVVPSCRSGCCCRCCRCCRCCSCCCCRCYCRCCRCCRRCCCRCCCIFLRAPPMAATPHRKKMWHRSSTQTLKTLEWLRCYKNCSLKHYVISIKLLYVRLLLRMALCILRKYYVYVFGKLPETSHTSVFA